MRCFSRWKECVTNLGNLTLSSESTQCKEFPNVIVGCHICTWHVPLHICIHRKGRKEGRKERSHCEAQMAIARPLATIPPTSWPGLAVPASQVLPGPNGFLPQKARPSCTAADSSFHTGWQCHQISSPSDPNLTPCFSDSSGPARPVSMAVLGAEFWMPQQMHTCLSYLLV